MEERVYVRRRVMCVVYEEASAFLMGCAVC